MNGQLHNALVDIAVTLRVYLKLTNDIDICNTANRLPEGSNTENNVNLIIDNTSICRLINPVNINTNEVSTVDNSDYSGELIVAYKIKPNELIEQSVVVAKEFVDNIISNSVKKLSLDICTAVIKSGKRKNQTCGRARCNIHTNSDGKIVSKFSRKFVSNILNRFTKKNKVHPVGGKYKKKYK